MDDVGYIYVLANSAMPGLVKIGKTTRTPAGRASELSGATGIPTQFIVVYEQLFSSCSSAEQFVHTYLAQKGYRVADNREFFNAPTNEVVKAIALAPGAIDSDSLIPEQHLEDATDASSIAGDELDALNLSVDSASYQSTPWESVFQSAINHYYGLGDCIQDFTEAHRLFRQAANLDSIDAYSYLGVLYFQGLGVNKSNEKALGYYKEGARRGDFYCYWWMGNLFEETGHIDNRDKCYKLFLNNKDKPITFPQSPYAFSDDDLVRSWVDMVMLKIETRKPIPLFLESLFFKDKNYIQAIKGAAERFESAYRERQGGLETAEQYHRVVAFMESLT